MTGETTDTWVIVLAAFGGGLVGAILQPVASYLVERIRATEQIVKRREQHLRGSITMWLEFGREHVGTWRVNDLRALTGLARLPYEELIKGVKKTIPPPWEGERIVDTSLRTIADDFVDEANLLAVEMRMAPEKVTQERIDTIEKLRAAIIKRMDELNFPEVDA